MGTWALMSTASCLHSVRETHQSTSLVIWHEGLIKGPQFQDVEGGLPWPVWIGLLPGERGTVWSSRPLMLLLQLHPADAVSVAAEEP